MTHPPQIFDRALLRRRLARAARAPCDFLAHRVAEDFVYRLSGISRPFANALDYGSPHPAAAQALAAPGRKILRAAPSLHAESADLVIDEEFSPFAPEKFDLVFSALSLQWVNDLPGVFAQLRRSLAPDGLLLAAMVGGQSFVELRHCLTQAQEEFEGGASPRVFPFVDLRDLGGLLQRAGFALPVADCDAVVVRYDNLFALLRDLRGMGATNILAAGARRPLSRRVLLRAAELYQQNFSDPDGRIRASVEILWLSGWAPHESQQKPLRPGSAQIPLSSALGDKSKI
ncbi:SAM-dependent methyltransferase [Rhodoblastus acidophilus]|uniref:methyltransferase domain-containing protein n=1 Tax=Rhodoblastus acidophilus TaxID=1074 RepID=UPI00222561E4|nr:methyltransferase domain-containing protein [Rhodoblastus acidophilus]MCW2283730.1 SAM-dependent methyltransferase [Rhodoblastus acidophilus]MCW2332921.1 SAM-dependent methyltransferase [Rhodoblastus acidophilus]